MAYVRQGEAELEVVNISDTVRHVIAANRVASQPDIPLGEGEDDEREFTALGERDREIHFVRDALQPHREGQDEKHPGLHNQEDRKSEDHFHRLRHDEMHVDTHADGHEEETEKELLKGRNLGFQLVPETRAAEKQTADKAAHGGPVYFPK